VQILRLRKSHGVTGSASPSKSKKLGFRREQVMRMAREEEAITQTFNNYIQTFQTLDPHATLPYFHVPCMFIPPQGVRVLAMLKHFSPKSWKTSRPAAMRGAS
jgi:hypothetical protein